MSIMNYVAALLRIPIHTCLTVCQQATMHSQLSPHKHGENIPNVIRKVDYSKFKCLQISSEQDPMNVLL